MKDLTLHIIFFAELLFAIILIVAVVFRFRLLCFCAQKAQKSLSLLKSKDLPFYYSSLSIKQECTSAFFKRALPLAPALERAASRNLTKTAKKIRSAIKKTPQDFRLLLLNAETSLLLNDRPAFSHIMENLSVPFFSPRPLKAKFFYLHALHTLYLTDMETASRHASAALKLYKSLHFSYEEAQCYLALAEIYRMSGVFDIAFTMLKEAKKIFSSLGLNAKLAETEAYFGLIEIGRENCALALEYLSSAAKIAKKHHLQHTLADINNWQGLSAFLLNKQKQAASFFQNAGKNGTPHTAAFAAEMLARLNFKQNRLKNALKYADTALSLNQNQNHRAGIFENLYLKAEILYQNNQPAAAKKILTTLIKEKTPSSTSYYPANAYTFLGLIELKQHHLNKAKTLFKQALDMEHARNRLKGAAIDYNNLAQIALMENNKTEAKSYINQALSYARTIEDKELEDLLKHNF